MSTLQNLKDTFYLTLRDRLAALNPERTILLRGAARPAMVVPENEIAFTDNALLNCYLLHWDSLAVDRSEAMALMEARCTVRYSTDGLPELAGMDRGRTLADMDAELLAILLPAAAQPVAAPQRSFDGPAPTTLVSNVFWSDPVVAPAAALANRLSRGITVQVFAWQEGA